VRSEKSGVSVSRRGSLGEVEVAHLGDVYRVWRACFFGPFFQERAECFSLEVPLGKEGDGLPNGPRSSVGFLGG